VAVSPRHISSFNAIIHNTPKVHGGTFSLDIRYKNYYVCDCKGGALVEFALLLGVLLPIGLGMSMLGKLTDLKQTSEQASLFVARLLAMMNRTMAQIHYGAMRTSVILPCAIKHLLLEMLIRKCLPIIGLIPVRRRRLMCLANWCQ